MTINLSPEQIQTVIFALHEWMEQPSEWEGEEWLRRQDAGADLVLMLESERDRPEPAKARTNPPVVLCINDPVEW